MLKRVFALLSVCVVKTLAQQPPCGCYVVNPNSTDTAYFLRHIFRDYRSLPQYASVPPVIKDAENTTIAPATSNYFAANSSFSQDWTIQNWNNGYNASNGNDTTDGGPTILMINSMNNVYIDSEHGSTFLSLRTARLQDFQSTAEIDSLFTKYQYISLRLFARIQSSAPGAVAGMFTYTCLSSDATCASANSTAVQEADIEILTSGPQNKVQLTNQPSVDAAGNSIPQSSLNATISTGTWAEWVEYRFDWTPTTSRWYANGSELGAISFQTPKAPSSLILNMWSDGGIWSGVMPVGGEARLQIQWIQLLFNESTQTQKRNQGGCIIECSIDKPGTILGQAIVAANNTAHSAAGPHLRGDVNTKLLWELVALVVVVGICHSV